MNPASNLVLIGPMGAGKSVIGRRLADRFGLRFLDLDGEIEQRAGAAVSAIFEHEGEAGFRRRERELLAELLEGNDRVLATGGGAVLDADNRRRMRERGFVVHLHIGVDAQLARLAQDRSRPLLASGDRAETLLRLAAQREPLYAQTADLRFEPAQQTAAESAAALAALLETQWRRGDAPRRASA